LGNRSFVVLLLIGLVPAAGCRFQEKKMLGPSAQATAPSDGISKVLSADTTPPSITIHSGPSNYSNASAETFVFSTTDASGIASIECRLDGGAFQPCSSPRAVSSLTEGLHSFVIRATDRAGNSYTRPAYGWTVDLSGHLVKNGVAFGVIQLPSPAKPKERFAAEELQLYIKRISGADVSIIEGPVFSDRTRVIVGDHPDTAGSRGALAGQGPEAFIVQSQTGVSVPRYLAIAGATEGATAYAAWDFLETLGVRWFLPSHKGEWVPSLPSIRITDHAKLSVPVFTTRNSHFIMVKPAPGEFPRFPVDADLCEHGKEGRDDCELHERASRLYNYRARINSNNAVAKGVLSYAPGVHTVGIYVPLERYYGLHPEWFRMRRTVDIQRLENGLLKTYAVETLRSIPPNTPIETVRASAWQVDFTNETVAREFARNAAAEYAALIREGASPDRLRLIVGPNDEPLRCKVDGADTPCKKWHLESDWADLLDENVGGGADSSFSSLVMRFTRDVEGHFQIAASQLYADLPQLRQVKIDMSAYQNYALPPVRMPAANGIGVSYASWASPDGTNVDYSKPLFAGANLRFELGLAGWIQQLPSPDRVIAYEYYGHYNWFTPWPQKTQIASNIRAFASRGVRSMFATTEFSWGTQGLNMYLYPKLLWNPNLDVAALASEYYEKGYGAQAGTSIRQCQDRLQAQMDTMPGRLEGNELEVYKVFNASIRAECGAWMSNARSVLASLPASDQKWRAQLAVNALTESSRFARITELRASPVQSAASKADAMSELRGIASFACTNDGRWAFDTAIFDRAAKMIIEWVQGTPPPAGSRACTLLGF
jgi:hypothetical protein